MEMASLSDWILLWKKNEKVEHSDRFSDSRRLLSRFDECSSSLTTFHCTLVVATYVPSKTNCERK